MATKIVHFYATKEDLLPVLKSIEEQSQIKYVLTGLLESADLQTYQTAADIPSLGIAKHENAIACAAYLVADREKNIVSHKRPQNAGGVRYEVSQMGNPQTITFQPGGLFDGKALLYGRIGTISDAPESLALFRFFATVLRKHFKKADIYYVGSKAYELWKSGTRLTQAVQSPPEFDLVCENRVASIQ